jgi:hypothetical protein
MIRFHVEPTRKAEQNPTGRSCARSRSRSSTPSMGPESGRAQKTSRSGPNSPCRRLSRGGVDKAAIPATMGMALWAELRQSLARPPIMHTLGRSVGHRARCKQRWDALVDRHGDRRIGKRHRLEIAVHAEIVATLLAPARRRHIRIRSPQVVAEAISVH